MTATTATATAGEAGSKRKRPSDSKANPSSNRNRNHNNQKPSFEERFYRGLVCLDAVVAPTTDNPNENENDKGSHISHDYVALPVAVRSCWPDLFPTMSSAKKSIRKGIFFVRHSNEDANASANENASASSSPNKIEASANGSANGRQDSQKGKCGTRIVVGDTLLRKLPASSVADGDDDNADQQQLSQSSQRFRIRGQSTEDIIACAIGGKLKLAYLDPHLAVVVKPHGMPVQKVLVPPASQSPSSSPAVTNNNDCKCGTIVATAATTATANTDTNDNDSSKNNSRVISMHEMLLHCLPPSDGNTINDPLRRPAAIHRLDRPTYGLLIVARTRPSARFLGKVFEDRTETLVKRYRAIVHGHLPGSIIIDNDNDNGNNDNDGKASEKCTGDNDNDDSNNGDGINRSDNANPSKRGGGTFVRSSLSGKECLTEYFIVKKLVVVGDGRGGLHSPLQLTLVDLVLHTGRKHQLRRHMASLGHPIVGDTRYGRSKDDQMVSEALVSSSSSQLPPCGVAAATKPNTTLPLMLAAVEITFPHPIGGPRTVTDSNSSSNNNNEVKYKYCVMAKDSKHSFDASRRTLNVAIPMPDSMQYILRNSSSSSSSEN